ncbi:MAG: hypothetical protein ACC645_06660 [Pirellulales bacterium]
MNNSWRVVAAALGLLLSIWAGLVGAAPPRPQLNPQVEVEEEVYQYVPAGNGAGPMWCHGNTCLIRVGDDCFASGLTTVPAAKPLNNCLPLLFFRKDQGGWKEVYRGNGRTREPSPLGLFPGGPLLMSINPTLLTSADVYSGPARPQVLQFDPAQPGQPTRTLTPDWQGSPRFTEHSYRSFAVDGPRRELILLQNIGYTHAEWTFRDAEGHWSARGRLDWPSDPSAEKPQPIRTCYPAGALRDRQVHFFGVGDIVGPNQAWREYKKKTTGRAWDYVFRRLFYTWSDDITTGQFHDWVEVANYEATAGKMFPGDLYLKPGGDVYLLWREQSIDPRLKETFFPEAKQRHRLQFVVLRDGRIVSESSLVVGGDGYDAVRPGTARFQVTEDGRVFIIYHVAGQRGSATPFTENRLVEVLADGTVGDSVRVPLTRPLADFYTATVRAGCRPSRVLDLLGTEGQTVRYARVRLW